MWLFSRRPKPNDDEVEAELQKIKKNIAVTTEKANTSLSKLADELEAMDKTDDITLNIFLATGGTTRLRKK